MGMIFFFLMGSPGDNLPQGHLGESVGTGAGVDVGNGESQG